MKGKKIAYSYDTSGVKLRKVVTDGIKVTTTDYLGGFQYVNNILQFFPTAEGYVNVINCQSCIELRTYNYVYNYTDHLGNVRLSYAWDDTERKLEVLEENHYYPFGLKHKGYVPLQQIIVTPEEVEIGGRSTITAKVGDIGIGIDNSISTGSATYNYKYNGKELQEEFNINLYDYGARNYDPAIGRWMNVDPLAEKFFDFTPYNYVMNNPIRFVDIDGMDVYLVDQEGNFILAKKENNTDVLYGYNSKTGELKDYNGDGKTDSKDGLQIQSKNLLSQMLIKRKSVNEYDYSYNQIIAEDNENHERDLLKIFKFSADVAENSELSLAYFKNNGKDWISLQRFTNSTLYKKSSPGFGNIGVDVANASKIYHNHPASTIYKENYTEINSMGNYSRNGTAYRSGDFKNANNEYNGIPYYVYFPKSSNLYLITHKSINLIKTINKSKDLKQ